MIKGLKHLSCEEKLRELQLLNLEEARGDFISVYKCLKGGCKEDWSQAFFNGAQCQDKRPWAQSEIQQVPSQH